MRRIGLWQSEPPPPEAFESREAFAMDAMAFSQWLQFLFVPRVRGLLAEGGDWPSESQGGAKAAREFDGMSEAEGLCGLLADFDALFIRA